MLRYTVLRDFIPIICNSMEGQIHIKICIVFNPIAVFLINIQCQTQIFKTDQIKSYKNDLNNKT